jgi:aspartate/methionine/tyrosine aminotransferase
MKDREAFCQAVSRRAREITPFLVMDILERAQELERQGESIIHLEIGEPDFDTPQAVLVPSPGLSN